MFAEFQASLDDQVFSDEVTSWSTEKDVSSCSSCGQKFDVQAEARSSYVSS
jgi:hypothetical protein